MKTLLISLFFIFFSILCLYAQEPCGTMQNLEEMMKKDPSLSERMEKIEMETQNWIKNNEISNARYIETYKAPLNKKHRNLSTPTVVLEDGTWVDTISAPTIVGQTVSPSSSCTNAGDTITVIRGLVPGSVYSIYTGGQNNVNTKISVYSESGDIATYDEDSAGSPSHILFSPIIGGDYDIHVIPFQNPIIALLNAIVDPPVKLPAIDTTPITIIPVVFHVLHDGSPVGTGTWKDIQLGEGTNISDARLNDVLSTLNKDFRNISSDVAGTPFVFKKLSTDARIEFCLAKQDPNGNPTTGIIRTLEPRVNTYTTVALFRKLMPKSIWDRNKYLNIYICEIKEADAFSQLPGGADSTDGVALSHYKAGNSFRTITHEVGHWLNLRHIWGDKAACAGDDFVDDTPPQAAPNFGCPPFPLLDTCSPYSPGVMYYNHMDYSSNGCRTMFTKGQVDRMRAALAGFRSSLKTSKGCIQPAPKRLAGENVFDAPESISVYPNPSNGVLSLSVSEEVDAINLYVINILGEKVFEKSFSGKETTVDLKNQPNGVYFLKINSENGSAIKKIIINK